jgi:REP-associated tyrosine transposase
VAQPSALVSLSRFETVVPREEPRRAFWQPRFYDFNVWTVRKRVEKLRYMHRNLVKRGLENLDWKTWGQTGRTPILFFQSGK